VRIKDLGESVSWLQTQMMSNSLISVEALWLAIRIRFLMGELAEGMLKAMEQNEKYSPSIRFVWASFIRFIYLSCCQDVLLARGIATKSESHRQIASSGLLELRATFESLRFNVHMWAQRQHSQEERDALLEDSRNSRLKAGQLVQRTIQDYLFFRRMDSEKVWVGENLTAPASKIMDQWSMLETSIRTGGTFYSPVSLDELTQVATSFTDFTTRGHWYSCPNGHVYVIGYVVKLSQF
jgi:RZ type zinc finger domain